MRPRFTEAELLVTDAQRRATDTLNALREVVQNIQALDPELKAAVKAAMDQTPTTQTLVAKVKAEAVR